MSGRKYYGIIFAFVGIIIAAVVGIILAANWSELGYKRELKKIYFEETSELVYLGVDSYGHEQRIVAEKGYSNGKLVFTGRLVHLEKDDRGRWTMKGQSAPKEITDQLGYFCYEHISMQSLVKRKDLIAMRECHLFVFGNDARYAIPADLSAYLPPNVTVDVYQQGSSYLLHFISFTRDTTDFTLIDGRDILVRAGAIVD